MGFFLQYATTENVQMDDEMLGHLREVQRLQRIPCTQEPGEADAAFDERVRAREAVEDEWIGTLYYRGNSVSWSHSKAARYRSDLGKVWDALREIGIYPDGETHAADAIRKFAVRRNASVLKEDEPAQR